MAGAGGWDPLAGSEIHGFITYADLNFEKLMGEAATRWFRPNEIYALLANHTRFKVQAQPYDKPSSGTVVLYDRKVVRNFRKDGHNWKKKKDGKTVQEAHEKLKIGNEERVHVYYARGEDDPNFFRRCYWLLDKDLERIVLVHYRQTSEENATAPPNAEAEVAEVPMINTIHHTSPLTSVDSTSLSAHTELSCAAAPEEINSRGGGVISSASDNHDPSLVEINTFWADILESSLKNDPAVCGGSFTSNQQGKYELRESVNNVSSANPTSNASFVPSLDAISEAYASDLGVNQAPASYFGAVSDQGGQSQSFQTSNPDDYICLGDNPSSAVLTSLNQSAANERLFNITDISPEWAYSTGETKVLVVGYFLEKHKHLAGSTMYCVFGSKCVAAEIVQTGVYRCMAGPHTPGPVNFYLTLDGDTPISQVFSFEYRVTPSSLLNGEMVPLGLEDKKSKLQMQMRLARLLFFTSQKKLAPKLLVEGSKAYNLTSISTAKEWMDLWKFAADSKDTSFPATEGLLELVLRNKLKEWLLEKLIEGHKSTGHDDQGQGAIHLCTILDYTWAVRLFSLSGYSLDFRDSSGWTALHWAAYYGREKMVATLLSAGANPSLVTDPTAESHDGYTAADLAAKQGYDGLAAYLAEIGLTAHFESMSVSKNTESAPKARQMKLQTPKIENLSEQELCLRESLAAYRNAADAASNIQAALRERTLKLHTKAVQLASPENEAAVIVAAMKIQHAYRNYNKKKIMRAAARIQSHFRTWKIRKTFMNMRRQAVKIQSAYRGHLVRKQYCKVIWSVGVLEKAILRWRKKRKGLRGMGTGTPVAMNLDTDAVSAAEEDFFQVGRQQAEDRFNRSVVRVQALFRCYRAQQEYRRMKVAYEQAKLEFS